MSVTSLGLSGLNRTDNEIADRNALIQHSYGGSLRFTPNDRLQVSLNALGERLSRPLLRTPRPYNRFYFNGDRLHNVSLDYRYRWRNFSFFGEVAGASGGGKAMLHGLNLGAGPAGRGGHRLPQVRPRLPGAERTALWGI